MSEGLYHLVEKSFKGGSSDDDLANMNDVANLYV